MSRYESAFAKIRRHCRGVVLDLERLRGFERDFGGMIRRRPGLVLRAADEADLVRALQVAYEHEVPVTVRGAGHSQSGQGLGSGLVLDLRELNDELTVDSHGKVLVTGGGTMWSSAASAAFECGLLPAALTHVLDTTLAGTLSVGGVGAESWSYGPQVDNVSWMEVLTLDGERLRCDLTENRDLFDGVRAGLGQCGVIVRVGYPLRSCGRRLRLEQFLYRDVDAYVADVSACCSTGSAARFANGAVLKTKTGGRVLRLSLGRDYDPAAGTPPGPLAKNLHADFSLPEVDLELWRTDGQPGHPFFQLFEPLAGPPALRETRLHPWVDHTFSSEVAASVLKRLCYRPPRALDYGVVGLIFIRRGPEPAPLLMVPETTGLLWGIGMFAEFPAYARSEAIAIMAEYAEALRPYGGTRYLSGFRPFEGASGKEYYGRHGQRFWETKTRHDHKHLLNAGFFEDEASSREASA